MCHNCINNRKADTPHESCLRITDKNKNSSFEELIQKDCSVSIHDRNIQILATKSYKTIKSVLPGIISGIFKSRNQ